MPRESPCDNCGFEVENRYPFKAHYGYAKGYEDSEYLVDENATDVTVTKTENQMPCDYCMMWRGVRVGQYATPNANGTIP